jgi:hypothetical protein
MGVRVLRRARFGLIVLALLAPATTTVVRADSRAELYQQLRNHPDEALFQGSERIDTNESESRRFVQGATDRPSWLPRVLARLRSARGANVKLSQHILFHQNGKPTYLALVWHGGPWEDVFELHRVRVISDGNVQLKFDPIPDRKYFKGHFDIVEPSGRDAFGDGIPRLFLHYSCGGKSSLATACASSVSTMCRQMKHLIGRAASNG